MIGKAGRPITTMVVRMPVRPDLLSWAADRAGPADEELERRLPKFAEWHSGELTPTFKQLEHFANAAHVPLGYFFLEEPPEEPISIPDFRTLGSAASMQQYAWQAGWQPPAQFKLDRRSAHGCACSSWEATRRSRSSRP